MSDRLAKRFSHHLSIAVSGDRGLRHILAQAGRYDFLNTDRPETDDPVVMASEAFVYLGLEDGQWRQTPQLLAATISFLQEQVEVSPSAEDIQRLGELIQNNPVDSDMVREWFRSVYD